MDFTTWIFTKDGIINFIEWIAICGISIMGITWIVDRCEQQKEMSG